MQDTRPVENVDPSPGLRMLTTLKVAVVTTVVACLAIFSAGLYVAASSQDKLVAEDSRRQFRGLAELYGMQLASHVRDYSNWTEAVQKLAIEPDPVWWKDNAGDFAVNGFKLDHSLFVTGQNQLLFHSAADKGGPKIELTPSLQALIESARAKPRTADAEEAVAVGYIELDGAIMMAAAATLASTEDNLTIPDENATLVFARRLEGKVLDNIGRLMAVEKIAVGKLQDMSHPVELPVALLDGAPWGVVSWEPPTPGVSILKKLLPLAVIFMLAIGGGMAYAQVRSRKLKERMLAEEDQLATAKSRATEILSTAAHGIFGVDREGVIQYVNAGAVNISGYAANELIGRSVYRMVAETMAGSRPVADGASPVEEAMTKNVTVQGGVTKFRRKDGAIYYIKFTVAPTLQDDRVVGAVVSFVDVSSQVEANKKLREQQTYDPLTRLYSRKFFVEALARKINDTRGPAVLTVILLDLDNFKQINDSFGYAAGDLLLKKVSDRIQASATKTAWIARIGADDFLIALPEERERSGVRGEVQRIIEHVSGRYVLDGAEAWVSVSAGVSVYPEDGEEPTELLHNAELAMRSARQLGPNNLEFFSRDLVERRKRAYALESELRSAIAEDQLRVEYQPIVLTSTGEVSHLEALLRWNSPSLGPISPAEFIPIAEDSGLIADIGNWVFEECCRQVRAWRDDGLQLSVAINVSSQQVPDKLPASKIRQLLDDHGVSGDQILIEITESVLISSPVDFKKWLLEVKALGIRVVLDDFGTGYSSLAYLSQYKIDGLKIDKTFVSRIDTHEDDRLLIGSILSMAHSLGLAVTAEGVETASQMDWLAENRCDYLQGYLFARPLSRGGVTTYLQGASLQFLPRTVGSLE